jgi:predicted flap endonuclease-1-like 5' DNA nuclease
MLMTNAGLFGVGTTARATTLHLHGCVRFDSIAALAGTDLVIDGDPRRPGWISGLQDE